MNKKELTEAIEDGILGATNKFAWSFIIGIVIIAVILVGLQWWGNSHQSEQQAVGTAVAVSNCQFEMWNCLIHPIIDNQIREDIIETRMTLCGYQEANAWFDYYSRNLATYKKENLIMDCR